MKVLTIGHDKDLLRRDSAVSERFQSYAKHVDELHAIVFARKGLGFTTATLGEHITVHPTNSSSTVNLFIDAYRLGKQVLGDGKDWVIAAQDPFESGVVAYALSRSLGVPFQVQEHGDFYSTPHWRRESIMNRVRAWIGLRVLRRADSVRVVSKRIARTLEGRGVAQERITIAPVYTDCTLFMTASPAPALEALRPADGILVLTMARLVPQKDLPLLIHAFGDVIARGIRAHLAIIGRGPEKERLTELAKKVAPEHITFQDWTDVPASALKAADVYVLSSKYEGWARVAIEALAAGTPLIMTDVGCAGEVVRDKENGLVVPVGDREALTEALVRVASDPHLRSELAKNGRIEAERMPTLEESTKLYLESLKRCMMHRTWQNQHNNTRDPRSSP